MIGIQLGISISMTRAVKQQDSDRTHTQIIMEVEHSPLDDILSPSLNTGPSQLPSLEHFRQIDRHTHTQKHSLFLYIVYTYMCIHTYIYILHILVDTVVFHPFLFECIKGCKSCSLLICHSFSHFRYFADDPPSLLQRHCLSEPHD